MRLLRTVGFGMIALGMSVAAGANPLQVTGGALVFDIEGDVFGISGEDFDITSRMPDFGHIAVTFSSFCFPCHAGQTLDLSFKTTAGEQPIGSGPATIGGTSHAELFYAADLSAHATPLSFPATMEDSLNVVRPFSMTGTIRAFTNPEFSTPVFSTTFVGQGQAHTLFFRDLDSGAFFPEEGQLVYDFQEAAPVPEPATLLLTGSVLAALSLRRGRVRGH